MAERLDFVLRLIDKITAPAKRVTRGLKGIDTQLNKIGKNRAFEKIGKAAGMSGREMISLSANLSLASSQLRMLSRQAAGIFIAPIKEAATFEKSISAVRAVTSDFTESQRDLARQLGRDTKFTADEAAQAMLFLGRAGFNAKQQMASLSSVLDLDAASGMDNLGRSADVVTNIMSGFQLQANKTKDSVDILTRVFTNSNVTLEELGETMSFAAPVAKQLGVSLKQTAILAGALGDAGIKGSRGGTALRLIMVNLAGASKPAAKALKSLGIATKDASGDLRPVTKILDDVVSSFDGLGNAQQTVLATKLFGLRGASAGLVLLDSLSKKASGSIAKLTQKAGDLSITAKSVAEVMEDNLLGDITKVESAFSALKIEIGDQFTPELRDLAKEIKGMIPPMVEWVKENKSLVITIGKSVAVFAAATAALAALATAVGSALLVVGGLKIAFGALGGAAVLKALTGSAGKLRGAFSALWTGIRIGIRAVVPAAITGFKGMVTAIGGSLLALGGLVVLAAAGWTLAIVTWWSDIKLLIADIPSSFLELGASMAQGLIDGWEAIFGRFNIADDIARLAFKIEDFLGISSPSKFMMGIGENMAKGLQIGMNGGMNANAPARFAGAAASSMAGGGGGARTMVFRPTIQVTMAGGGGSSEGEAVAASVETTIRGLFDDAVAALGAG